MDKNAIKKYAVWARRELISRVSQRAALYEITADGYGDQNATSVHGRVLSAEEKKQRQALIAQIREKGYEQVMEEIAYTWFNRFSALRFMEVNGYLPSRVRVFTDDGNAFKPQILAEAINLDLDGLSMDKVYELKNANDDDALFKYLIITQCNALSSILPGMFQKISDYTELLFPDNLLREGSVIEQMVTTIPESDWTDQVQIIGWLYQYYNTEPKDKVFADLKKNIKITKENIPAATQLFTPDWIVRYMVENSLGRLWLEGHPNDDLKSEWKYYLDEAEQEPEVQAQLAEIRKEYAALKPEDILTIDPCQGSGHILAYMFDVLVQIYEAYGYSAREAVASIVEHNIWGLDIDDRAAQLAYFSVMMKARQYDARFFKRGIQPHVYAIIESNNLDPHCIEYFADGRPELKSAMATLVKELHDAKEYGSILNVTQVDFDDLYTRFDEIRDEAAPSMYTYQAIESLLPFVQVAQAMAQKYHAVVTNPPYMGSSGMSSKLLAFVSDIYPDTKSDLSTVFMEHTLSMCSKVGRVAMINIPVWMFLISFKNQRNSMILTNTFSSLVHFGRGVFGADFGTVSFVIYKQRIRNYRGYYLRLFDKSSSVDTLEEKEKWFFERKGHSTIAQEAFEDIAGMPIAYWATDAMLYAFNNYPALSDVSEPRQGLITGDNDRFLREWQEVELPKINKKWFVYNKGGNYRKWYGNNDLVVNWENDGFEINNFINEETGKLRSRPQNVKYYYRDGFTWTTLSIGDYSARYMPQGQIFDAKGSSCFANSDIAIKNLLALTNSKVSTEFFKILSPTVDYSAGSIGKLPVAPQVLTDADIYKLASRCIELSAEDWNCFEKSWEFITHPFIRISKQESMQGKPLEMVFDAWSKECDRRFDELKKCEEELNNQFLSIYKLDSISPYIEEESISVSRADLQRDIRSFISFAVGCILGRFSLDKEGIAFAGGEWNPDVYSSVKVDRDNIVPICDDEYFEDDVVGLFVKFVKTAFGDANLERNLSFIADALNGKGSSREVIRNYFINDFYKDHCSIYSVSSIGKRPIYWLFDSGKKNGFKCLIYMHRYQPDTIARIRTDYVHEQQSRYRTAIADLESRIANAGTSERVKLTKQLKKLQDQAEEVRVYEEKIHHLADQMIKIDLDDGVKHNYAIFQDVLAKIK